MSTPQLSPPGAATPYAEDDANTNRVLLAFADLHATLRDRYQGRWEPRYYRLPADTDWTALRAHLDTQAAANGGWNADANIGEQGNGYVRRVWSDGDHAVAAGFVQPAAGAPDAAAVLMVLSPRD